MGFLKRLFSKITHIYGRLGIIKTLSIVLVVIILLVIFSVTKSGIDSISDQNIKVVETGLVAMLSLDKEPLSLVGNVESKSEADIRAESQGEVTRVYAKLGDNVFAGQVLAEIENGVQRATLTQANAQLEASEANLLKLKSGSRTEDKEILFLSTVNAEKNFEQSKVSAINTIKNAVSVVDDILFNKVDQLFINPRITNPELNFVVPEYQTKIDIESGRFIVGGMLKSWKEEITTLTVSDDLLGRLKIAEGNLNKIRGFIDDIARAVNIITPTADLSLSTINGWQADILLARTSINTTLTSITGSINSLNSSVTALEIANKNQEKGIIGGRSEDIKAGEASVKQAEGSVAAARASLEKTIIRTPITGTLNMFSVDRGDFVSLFQPVAVVSNNNALEITAFITENDKNQISIGSKVLIDSKYEGVVTNIAPALNPITKKIEVTISPLNDSGSLINGSSVRVAIERDVSIENIDKTNEITIPISALKIKPNEVVVFTISNENALVAHSVLLGNIVGEKVVIKEGLDNDVSIVLDARGLREGQTVEVR